MSCLFDCCMCGSHCELCDFVCLVWFICPSWGFLLSGSDDAACVESVFALRPSAVAAYSLYSLLRLGYSICLTMPVMSMVCVMLLWIFGSIADGMVLCLALVGALADSVPGNELRNLLNCSCFEFPTSISALIFLSIYTNLVPGKL